MVTAINFSISVHYMNTRLNKRLAAHPSERIWIFFFTFAYKNTKVFSHLYLSYRYQVYKALKIN